LSVSQADAAQLERALELAERGRGTSRPNPMVGAVIVAGDEVVGEGWHERKGLPHAEVIALEHAGGRARGGTLYVTLEPCAHYGATPPCADAVLAAGIVRVLAATGDPNPRTNGRGFERLRKGGVDVELAGGELEWRARVQNEGYRTWIAKGRPFVTYKAAVTLDGKVASASGDARWVSGEQSRRLVHELRANSDAVAVGMGTVRLESPLLTARDIGAGRQPRRLAFGRGPLPEGSELELRSRRLEDELAALAEEGVQSLLLEGGPTLAGAFLRADLLDKLLLFVAPKLAGGDDAPSVFAGAAAERMADAIQASALSCQTVGDDVLLTAYLHLP
jgi:diaminohydroxyphosphoribosylaminopyrimidine deaminase/5-amino-6-(5-phosphoribosylamino)uracil reductase